MRSLAIELRAGGVGAVGLAVALGALPLERSYETVAGFVFAQLQHLPKTGEHIEAHGWRFEVIDLDGRRIDKVLASRIKSTTRVAA